MWQVHISFIICTIVYYTGLTCRKSGWRFSQRCEFIYRVQTCSGKNLCLNATNLKSLDQKKEPAARTPFCQKTYWTWWCEPGRLRKWLQTFSQLPLRKRRYAVTCTTFSLFMGFPYEQIEKRSELPDQRPCKRVGARLHELVDTTRDPRRKPRCFFANCARVKKKISDYTVTIFLFKEAGKKVCTSQVTY